MFFQTLLQPISNKIILILTALLILLGFSSNYIIKQKDKIIEEKIIKIATLEADLKLAKQQTEIQYVETVKEVNKIQKVYVPKIQYVTQFVKDKNETNCDAANRLIKSLN